MKNILKLLGGFLIGGLFGFVISAIIVTLVKDITLAEFLQKFTEKAALTEGLKTGLLGIVSFLLAIPIQVILHEGGHWVCGLLSGYRFVSFRIFKWTFIRLDGKIRVKRFDVAGTGGQCLLVPPERPTEQIPVVWYNLGGVLANVIVSVLAFLLMSVVDKSLFIHEFLFFLGLVGVFFALMNGIPMNVGGVSNDANNLLMMLKNPKCKRALEIQLRANALLQQGVTPKDMPKEWFEETGEPEYKNPLLLTIHNLKACYLLDRQEWEAAHQAFEEMYLHKDEIMGLLVKEIACELVFTSLVTNRMERARELYTDELKKYIEQFRKVMSSKERILCSVALLMDGNRLLAESIYDKVCQQRNEYLMQGEVTSDIALMQAILSR